MLRRAASRPCAVVRFGRRRRRGLVLLGARDAAPEQRARRDAEARGRPRRARLRRRPAATHDGQREERERRHRRPMRAPPADAAPGIVVAAAAAPASGASPAPAAPSSRAAATPTPELPPAPDRRPLPLDAAAAPTDPPLDPPLAPPCAGASPKNCATYSTAQTFSSTKYVPAVPHPLAVSMATAWDIPVIEYDSTVTVPLESAYSSCGKPPTVFGRRRRRRARPSAPSTATTISPRFAVLTVVSVEPCQTEMRGYGPA